MPIYSTDARALCERKKPRLARRVRRSRNGFPVRSMIGRGDVALQGAPMGRATLAGTGFLSGLFFVVLLGLVGIYVSVINASAVRGAQVRDLEQQIGALESERGELEIRAARLRAQTHAHIAQEEVELQRLGLSQYIEIVDESTVASR